MKKYLLFTLTILATTFIINAQAPSILWSQTFGGPNDDVGHDIIKTTDGGFALCGYTESYGKGGKDAIVIKIDKDGKVEWEKYFGDKGDEEANAIIQTSDGGYLFCGYTDSKGKGKKDFYIVKLDSKGVLQWETTQGGKKHDIANSVIETYDGNYVITGQTKSRGAGNYDIWTIKLDTKGDDIWRKTRGGKSMDVGNTVVEHPADSSLIVLGTTYSDANGMSDLWLIKFNRKGKRIWTKKYGDLGKEEGNALLLKSTGEYIMAGSVQEKTERYSNFWVVGFTAQSWDDWEQDYGSSKDEAATALSETTDNGVLACGYTNTYGEGKYDFWIMKFNAAGNRLWAETYGGPEDDVAKSIIALGTNEAIVCGYTESDGSGRKDIWVTYLK